MSLTGRAVGEEEAEMPSWTVFPGIALVLLLLVLLMFAVRMRCGTCHRLWGLSFTGRRDRNFAGRSEMKCRHCGHTVWKFFQ